MEQESGGREKDSQVVDEGGRTKSQAAEGITGSGRFLNRRPDLLEKWIRAFVWEDTVYCLSAHTSDSFCFQCPSNLLFVEKQITFFLSLSLSSALKYSLQNSPGTH